MINPHLTNIEVSILKFDFVFEKSVYELI